MPPPGRSGFDRLQSSITGITFTNRLSDERAAENQIRLNGSGVAAGDIDGDGFCDLYFGGLEGPNVLYRNLGNWKFQEITGEAGVACEGQFTQGVLLADVDGDDDLDLLVNSVGGGTRLFLNDGKGKFIESAAGGLFRRFAPTSMALADVDGDGDLDLYVANNRTTTFRSTGLQVLNVDGKRMFRPEDQDSYEFTSDGRVLEYGEPDAFYLCDGQGRFLPMPFTGGRFIDEDGHALQRPPRDWGLSVMFRDMNGDGAPDIYVCNDYFTPDRIWINDGKGRFRTVDRLALRNIPSFSMGIDFADLDRDGVDDFIVLDMLDRRHARRMMQISGMELVPSKIGKFDDRPQQDRNTVQLGRGDGTYVEVAHFCGLEASGWSWTPTFMDVDLDGYEDLLITTGHMFDTQDLDAENRIQALGPAQAGSIHKRLLMFPRLEFPKIAFRNRGDLTFEEVSGKWGFDEGGVAHGMCLADLDNDGDLDLAVNNLNGAAGLYRNENSAPRVGVRLKGAPPNTRGIGAKIWVHGGSVPVQSQEMICGGRYLSGDQAMRVFAAGHLTNQMRIEVRWRDGKRSVVSGVKANRIYEVAEAGGAVAAASDLRAPSAPERPIYEDVSELLGHVHHEEEYNDFARQPLLPNKLSQLGPGVAWDDLNGDGREDLIIGSGKGGMLGVYLNDGAGKFSRLAEPWLARPVTRDQSGIVVWNKAGGSVVVVVGSANYEDGLAVGAVARQYDWGGRGIDDSLAGGVSSVGPLALADVDGDGDLDLFVGGRVNPGRYPEPASSRLYRNEDGKWVLDQQNASILEGVGLVSGAVWSDLDGDGYSELVLACEWGPVRVYQNQAGQLKEATRQLGLSDYTGWWTGVTTGDMDGDGRLDLIVGNWGLNTKYRASEQQPRKIYYGDLDGNGTVDIVEAYADAGKEVPERDLNAVGGALPFVRQKFSTYAAYGQAGLKEIFGDQLKQMKVGAANTLAAMIFLNRGGRFEGRPLPPEAQWSPAFGVCVADCDGDGKEDVFLSQNFFAVSPETSRNDAGRGLWLRGDGRGNLRPLAGQASGVKVYGEQRGAAVCDYDQDGRVDLVVTQNGAPTKLYHNAGGKPGLRVRLKGPAGNPRGVGAVLRLKFEGRSGPAREIHAGSGYWSQDSTVPVLGGAEVPSAVEVHWPGGRTTTSPVPAGAKEILVNATGTAEVIR